MATDWLTTRELASICIDVRRDIVRMIHTGGSGHPGGSLSLVEILTMLYFEAMRIMPDDPGWSERDRLVLSKGHASSVIYAVLARRGFFPLSELATFNAPGSRLQVHIDMHRVPGIDISSGSLGHGLSVAVGMALADRMDGKQRKVFVVMSDGECQAGQVWEAAMAAAHFRLGDIIGFVDCNQYQTDGMVKDIMGIEPIDAKWRAFGWSVQQIDGHNLGEIRAALQQAAEPQDCPRLILARTVKGKGISYMENSVPWHSHAINDEEYQQAMAELDDAEQALRESVT